MGRLVGADGLSFELLPESRVGRSRSSDLRLAGSEASSQHAIIRWSPRGWTIRELNSRNGTLVDGCAAGAEDVLLRPGAALSFGSTHFVLVDASPPSASAQHGDTSVRGTATHMLLGDGPSAVTFSIHRGLWCMDGRPVQQQGVEIDGAVWALDLPDPPSTTDAAQLPHLRELRLTFDVPSHEEGIELVATHRGTPVLRTGRTYVDVLHRLAEARLRDHHLTVGRQGWEYADELARDVGVKRHHMDVLVSRARADFGRCVTRGHGLIERRRATEELRLAISPVQLEIRRDGGDGGVTRQETWCSSQDLTVCKPPISRAIRFADRRRFGCRAATSV